MAMRGGGRRRLQSLAAIGLGAVLFVALVLLAQTTLRGLRLDLTKDALYTVSDETREILDELSEPVTLTLYFSADAAEGVPYVVEDRCISLGVVPQARAQDFATISANEWLVASVPYTHGDIAFTAVAATPAEAAALGCAAGAPLFAADRTTWDHDRAITVVRLSYAPGYRIGSRIGALDRSTPT